MKIIKGEKLNEIKTKIRVGLFWMSPDYNNVILIADDEYFESGFEAHQNEDVIPSRPHRDVWNDIKNDPEIKKYNPTKFNSLPRGRVEYNSKDKTFVISVGIKISKEGINNITELFGLLNQNKDIRKNSFWDSK
jgi:hypothetical protein